MTTHTHIAWIMRTIDRLPTIPEWLFHSVCAAVAVNALLHLVGAPSLSEWASFALLLVMFVMLAKVDRASK